ncbi:MAG TPA: LysR family transcriptional regulator [Candidatus Dormibacteraeota bacterium]|nr:LysR family transcriptional regulator [Candidatus Dormibacteraeota bacterium]
MELRDLRAYLAVVETGRFTLAAERLHLVQSAVSDAVARLERELQVVLLERRRSGARPTSAGDELARWARLLVNAEERARREVSRRDAQPSGWLSLGLLPTLVPLVLPPLLRALRAQHPDLGLRVHEGLAPELLEQVRTADLDLAVLFFPTERVGGLEFVEVASRPLSVIVPQGHRLAGRRAVRMRELEAERWVTYPAHNPGRLWLEEACRLAGFAPRIAAEVETAAQQRIFVEAQVGIAMLPFQPPRGGGVRILQLGPPVPAFRVGYAFDPRLGGLATVVRPLLDEVLRS